MSWRESATAPSSSTTRILRPDGTVGIAARLLPYLGLKVTHCFLRPSSFTELEYLFFALLCSAWFSMLSVPNWRPSIGSQQILRCRNRFSRAGQSACTKLEPLTFGL